MPPSDICYGCPNEVKEMLIYVKSLRFNENPQYKYLMNLLKKINGIVKPKMGLRTKSLKFNSKPLRKPKTKTYKTSYSMVREPKQTFSTSFDDDSTCIMLIKCAKKINREKIKAIMSQQT